MGEPGTGTARYLAGARSGRGTRPRRPADGRGHLAQRARRPGDRTITAAVPVRVDDQLTALGRTLLPVILAMKDWPQTHIAEVHAARAAYDQAAG